VLIRNSLIIDMLAKVSIGWTWLERTLNGIIEELNRQKPLQSATIAIEESPNGTLLKVIGVSESGQTSGSGGGGLPADGKWCTLAVIDTSTGTCVTKTITYWGTPPK
jgi:hypothetical protein